MTTTLAPMLALLVWGAVLVWYTVRAKWWHSAMGRHIFLVSSSITLLLWGDLAFGTAIAQKEPIYWVALVAGIARFISMERAQRGTAER